MHRSVHNVVRVESTALATKNSGTNFKGKERSLCTHCGKLGHTVYKCYKLHGFPPGFKFKNNKNATALQVSTNLELFQGNTSSGVTDFVPSMSVSQALAFTHDQYQQLLTLIGSFSTQQFPKGQELHVANSVTCPSNVVVGNSINLKHSVFSTKIVSRRAYDLQTWVIDTGASDHIVCSIQLMTSNTEISHTMVEFPNGEVALVTHIGTIQLSSHITLSNVLCVPLFTFNLLSVSALTKSQSICLVFLSQFCFLQDLTCCSMIGMGKMHDGLYLLQDSSLSLATASFSDFLSKQNFKSFSAVCSSFLSTNVFSLWHSRLGHPSDVKVHSLSSTLHFLKNCCSKPYTVCRLAK